MKKKALLLVSMGVLACTVGVTALAVGGGPKLNAVFETKAASKNFTFNAATGSQFDSMPGPQDVNVTTGVSDPIHTTVAPESMELIFGEEGGRFVEAYPTSGYCGYSLMIGINNLTHFEIDMGVENGVGTAEMYMVALRDKGGQPVEEWGNTHFELDGDGKGTAHLEWDKGPTDGTVVEVNVSLYSTNNSPDTNLYIESLSLTWDC